MKRSRALFIILTVYIFAQFIWWMSLIMSYNPERKWMVLGEGSVFLLLIALGIYILYKSLLQEIKLARAQQNFLLAVSHELKTPLASSRLYLNSLQKHSLNEEKKLEILQKIQLENERLELLIEKILVSTQLDSSALHLNMIPADVSIELEQIVQRFKETAALDRDIALDLPKGLKMNYDSGALRSIVENLIDNALKYSPKHSPIQIKAKQEGKKIKISVSDHGPGIPKTESHAIFTKFYRIGDENTRKAKGTGLGLYIVKELTELQGGKIYLETHSNEGCTFVAEFPSH